MEIIIHADGTETAAVGQVTHTHTHTPTMTHVLIYYMCAGACVVQRTLKWCYSCTSYVCYSLRIMTGNVKHGGTV